MATACGSGHGWEAEAGASLNLGIRGTTLASVATEANVGDGLNRWQLFFILESPWFTKHHRIPPSPGSTVSLVLDLFKELTSPQVPEQTNTKQNPKQRHSPVLGARTWMQGAV